MEWDKYDLPVKNEPNFTLNHKRQRYHVIVPSSQDNDDDVAEFNCGSDETMNDADNNLRPNKRKRFGTFNAYFSTVDSNKFNLQIPTIDGDWEDQNVVAEKNISSSERANKNKGTSVKEWWKCVSNQSFAKADTINSSLDAMDITENLSETCHVCQKQFRPQPTMAITSNDIHANSILNYFSIKPMHCSDSSLMGYANRDDNDDQKMVDNIERIQTKNSNDNYVGNLSMNTLKGKKPSSCSCCDRPCCLYCQRKCQRCSETFCSFCCTLKKGYYSIRDTEVSEQTLCLGCEKDVL